MFGMNKWYNGLIVLVILVLLFKILGSSWWIMFALFGLIPCMGGWNRHQGHHQSRKQHDYDKSKNNDTYDGDTLIL
ncbi:MAG: hypothetical protein ACPG7F_08295 [Aggregatilineales bacterium]